MAPSFHTAWDDGLITLSDEFRIIRSPHLPATDLLTPNNPAGIAMMPADKTLWPSRPYLEMHRNMIFRH